MNFSAIYHAVRKQSEAICQPLEIEDYVVQPVAEVSPPKWHLGHTTWFFETFILKKYLTGYKEFDPQYNYVFNSYYETVGARVVRTDRGNLTRPTVRSVYQYRSYVDEAMKSFLAKGINKEIEELFILGLNHEQQHQELLCYDMKYILGHNPLFPAYSSQNIEAQLNNYEAGWADMTEGTYEIGYKGQGFCFDNELGSHKVYLQDYSISKGLVSNKEFIEFIHCGAYKDFNYWHLEGWEWVNENKIKAPLYWHFIDGKWWRYSLSGLKEIVPDEPVMHISFYEASAYAAFKGLRLPTEFEWEAASGQFEWGQVWEWTESAYLPYPGFSKAPGALGEYNGKFMVNQKVLKGASIATPPGHQRATYRNFFHPNLRWLFNGIRLAK
jgi:ergothioneine biosynthesis protein EgtB